MNIGLWISDRETQQQAATTSWAARLLLASWLVSGLVLLESTSSLADSVRDRMYEHQLEC